MPIRCGDIAAEGVVLLENNGVLPLTEDRKRIALYGAGAVLTRKGGTGSGDVSVEHVTNIVEALEEAGFEITTKSWLSDYEERIEKSETERFDRMKAEAVATGDPLMSVFLRNPQILVDGAELPRFAEKIDDETAVYIISRISGECADREALPGRLFSDGAGKGASESTGGKLRRCGGGAEHGRSAGYRFLS